MLQSRRVASGLIIASILVATAWWAQAQTRRPSGSFSAQEMGGKFPAAAPAPKAEPKPAGEIAGKPAPGAKWEYALLKEMKVGKVALCIFDSRARHVEGDSLEDLGRKLGASQKAGSTVTVLDRLGSDGWELVALDRLKLGPESDTLTYHFKRRAQ